MVKNIRIAILLGILLVVAVNSFYDKNQNWQKPVYVYLYPINIDKDPKVESYIQGLNDKDFSAIDDYIKTQSKAYHPSVRIYYRLGGRVEHAPPIVPRNGSVWEAIVWSLKFRYYHFKNKPDTAFTPNLSLYLQYHSHDKAVLTETSTTLQNGRMGVVNLFASPKKTANNNVVIAHESLHGFGATDKYDLSNGIPIYPYGYANPNQNPVYPQTKAELMAVHIPLSSNKFKMAQTLSQTVVGELTAKEVGWIK